MSFILCRNVCFSETQPMSSKLEKKTSREPITYSKTSRLVAYDSNICGFVSCTLRDAVIANRPREQNTPAMKE